MRKNIRGIPGKSRRLGKNIEKDKNTSRTIRRENTYRNPGKKFNRRPSIFSSYLEQEANEEFPQKELSRHIPQGNKAEYL
jgi:hypothetical protein